MKDRIAMKFNDSIQELQNRITELIKSMSQEIIKSITSYEIYTNPFFYE